MSQRARGGKGPPRSNSKPQENTKIQQVSGIPQKNFIPLLLFCFFLSGTAGLIYQVAWTKSLALLFGYSAYAVATVLAVFMGGLALGSALLGKWSERYPNAIALYGWIELGVAAGGILSFVGLAAFRSIYLSNVHAFANSALFLLAIRFLGAALVLFLPTFLMGGTLPILIRGVTRHSAELGMRLGRFYAVNTFGAVVGTLSAGFWLLPSIGLRLTIITAVVLNIIAGVMALKLSRTASSTPSPETILETSVKAKANQPVSLPQTISPNLLLAAFVLVGATAIAYEIGWTRLLATMLGSSTYAFTLMLGTFLTGIVVGSFLFEKWSKPNRPITLVTFASTQLFTTLSVLFFLIIFHQLPNFVPTILRVTQNSFAGLLLTQFLVCALAMFPAAVVFGFNFPAVVVLVANVSRQDSSHPVQRSLIVGRAYAANTCGAIVAAILTGFVLLPHLGSFRTVVITAVINLLLAIVLTVQSSARRPTLLIFQFVVLAALAFVGTSSRFYNQSIGSFGALIYSPYHSTRLTAEEIAATENVTFFEDGISSTIAVTRSEDYLALKTNGKVDASTVDTSTQLLLGHLGAIFHPHPRRALIIGFGGGMTASAVSKYPDVERIDCVEIEPAVLRAATQLNRLNRNVLQDPRLHIVYDDARNFLQTVREPYDLIISEPSNPWIAGVAALYTTEFYAALRDRLAPDGIFVQWVQAYALQPDDFRMILATLAPHFTDVSLWRSADRDFLLLARKNSDRLSFVRSRALWNNTALQHDFRELHLAHPESWPVYFRLPDSQIRALAFGAAVNTDDRTLLEYRAPRALLNEDLTKSLDALVAQQQPGLLPPNLPPEESAVTLLASAISAAEVSPERLENYLSALGSKSEDPEMELLRGRAALITGHPNQAIDHLKTASRNSTNLQSDLYWLVVAYAQSGSAVEARGALDELLNHDPNYEDALRLQVDLAKSTRDWTSAITSQKKLISVQHPTPAKAYCELGDLYLRNRDLKSAQKPLEEGLAIDSYSYLCRRDLGELQRATGNNEEAKNNLLFSITYFPEQDAKQYISLALAYKALGKRGLAGDTLKKGKRIFPEDTMLRNFKFPQ